MGGFSIMCFCDSQSWRRGLWSPEAIEDGLIVFRAESRFNTFWVMCATKIPLEEIIEHTSAASLFLLQRAVRRAPFMTTLTIGIKSRAAPSRTATSLRQRYGYRFCVSLPPGVSGVRNMERTYAKRLGSGHEGGWLLLRPGSVS
jgi:hypothetical protein